MISVVVVTYNSIKHIKACLDSIFSQKAHEAEVIIVDNASIDGTKEFIKNNYPQVKLIENDKNFGPAKARNQGIAFSKGAWVLTLDSDIVLENNFINGFNSIIKDIPVGIGMVAPEILDTTGKIVYSRGIYLAASRRFYDLDRGRQASSISARQKKIIGPCSAAAFYQRNMLEALKEKTGYFDERFFFLVEDVDLAWRAKKSGWGALFLPQAKCRHYGNGSNTAGQLRQYLSFRNRFYAIRKNDGLFYYASKIILLLCYDFPRMLYLLLFNRYVFKKYEII